ncbi:hypothetical protein ACOMHN_036188 [Nucella lapillus]
MVPMSRTGWNLLLIFGFVLHWNVNLAGAQTNDCVTTLPPVKTFSEVDPAGTSLVNLTGGANARWGFQIKIASQPSPSLTPYFKLEQSGGNASLSLNKTFDLEEIHELHGQTTLEFTINCSVTPDTNVLYQWFASVTSVNEFPPQFVTLPAGGFNISEDKGVGDTVETLQKYVVDKDVALNHHGYEFILLPYNDSALDGRQKFSLGDSLTGTLVVKVALDYETMKPDMKYYMLNVSVGDRNGKTSDSTFRINIVDADDQAPEFFHPNCSSPCFTLYTARIRDSFKGLITWLTPAPIAARDLDTLSSKVTYRLKKGEPENFAQFVTINIDTGVPSIIKPLAESNAATFYLIVEAVEDTPLKHSQQTSLILYISGRNSTEPTLPPIIMERPVEYEPAFRTATIVLGVLFGLLLVILVIFIVIFTLGSTIGTSAVLPKTWLSSEDYPPEVGGSPNSTRRKSRKSVTLAKSGGGGSRLDFIRSLKRDRPASPTLRSYASNPESERDPDMANLPVSREIDFDNNGVDGGHESYDQHEGFDQHLPVATISESEVLPYEDHVGLVYGTESMGEEPTGMSNPVYDGDKDGDNDGDHNVNPTQESPVYI